MKDSFILYNKYEEIFEQLSDEDGMKLLKAIFEYSKTGKCVLDGVLKAVFMSIKQDMDRNKEMYEETCRKNRENVKKRWKKEQNEVENIPNDTTVYDRIQSNTNGYHSIPLDTTRYDSIPLDTKNTDNDYDNDLKKKKESKKKEKEKPSYDEIISQDGLDDTVNLALKDFIQMRQMIKKPLTNRALELVISKLKKLSEVPNTQKEILEQSIMNNWQGIFRLKENNIVNENGYPSEWGELFDA